MKSLAHFVFFRGQSTPSGSRFHRGCVGLGQPSPEGTLEKETGRVTWWGPQPLALLLRDCRQGWTHRFLFTQWPEEMGLMGQRGPHMFILPIIANWPNGPASTQTGLVKVGLRPKLNMTLRGPGIDLVWRSWKIKAKNIYFKILWNNSVNSIQVLRMLRLSEETHVWRLGFLSLRYCGT